MMLDPWDWKTSAPEFIPSSSPSSNAPVSPAVPRTGAVFGPVVGAWCAPMPEPNICVAPMGPMCAAPGGPVTGGFQWQGYGSGYENSRSSGPEPILGKDTWEEEEDYAERIRAAQLQARYEMQLRSKEEELRSLQDRLNRKEDETARMQADFERDRQGLLYNLNQLSHAVAEKKVQDRWADGRSDGRQGWRRPEKGGPERNQGPQARVRRNSKPRLKPRDESPVTSSRRTERPAPPAVRRAPGPAVGAWSGARLEKFVRQTPGAMDFRPHHAADGSTSWTLKLCMDELNPPLNDEGMQVFCRWLHHTFQLMREQHQIRSMQSVWAEVSMAWNHMGDDALGRLLQALQRSQVRVRSLKFRGNGIGAAGLSQICDFIHEAHFNLRELDLSSNFLDESSRALQLLKLFVELPRYAAAPGALVARGLRGSGPEGVKVNLSHNGLHASKVLKKLSAIPGLSLQSMHRSSGTREWHVLKNGAPLLRLPNFEAQDTDFEGLGDRGASGSAARGPERQGGPNERPTAGREASPPEETPEPSAGEKPRAEKPDPAAPAGRLGKSSSRDGLVKVLRQQNGRREQNGFDKLKIVEHPNEDHPDPPKEKVIEDDADFPVIKDDLAALQEVAAPPKAAPRLMAPPKILQRGAPLEA